MRHRSAKRGIVAAGTVAAVVWVLAGCGGQPRLVAYRRLVPGAEHDSVGSPGAADRGDDDASTTRSDLELFD